MARKTTATTKTASKAAGKATGKAGKTADRQLTCFVVTGFGRKTDFATGRVLDLDKTWEQLVQPAFDQVGVNAFRAIDANLTGSIDSIMYQWLYEADMVIADLSTLNANVFYELGVRHAQKPNTTIIIAEMVLMSKIPFDLSSFVIHAYEHAGDQIAEEEQERFVAHLAKLLQGIIDVENARLAMAPDSERENDSPCYTFLPGMTPPQFKFEKHLAPPVYLLPKERAEKPVAAEDSLAGLIGAAEEAKKNKEYEKAIELFSKVIEIQESKPKKAGMPDPKPDTFLAQRLALVTYKNAEDKYTKGEIDKDAAIEGILEGEEILKKYCAPKISTDPETLGLSGAINKRLYGITDDTEYLDRAIDNYERGFYVKQDYYNGINVAFMYTMKANLLAATGSRYDAIVNYGHANMIRKKVAEIVQAIIDDEERFGKLADDEKQWVYMTQAEAYQGMRKEKDAQRVARKIEKVASSFGMDSFKSQQAKLQEAMDEFKRLARPQELSASAAGAPAADLPAAEAPAAEAPAAAVEPAAPAPQAVETRVAAESPVYAQGAIVVDADIVKGKPIKSVQVNCKIEYA